MPDCESCRAIGRPSMRSRAVASQKPTYQKARPSPGFRKGITQNLLPPKTSGHGSGASHRIHPFRFKLSIGLLLIEAPGLGVRLP